MTIKCAHRGTFQGHGPRHGRPTDWLVELWRPYADGEGPATPRELHFPADAPLTIEWEEWKPEQAIQGSMLTLRIESMTDREFLDYYTTQAGKYFIKVFRRDAKKTREWSLAWRGSLDPEFYEEPYERDNGYDVSMTFSDFGTLDRIDFREFGGPEGYSRDNTFNLLEMLGEGIILAGMADPGDGSVFTKLSPMTSSKLVDFDGTEYPLASSLGKIRLPFANFTDEEGKPDTWRDAIESAFMPLGLHIVQRAGKVLVYDTDFLVRNSDDQDWQKINWTSEGQTLSYAETYNNIELTFSPYLRSSFLGDKIMIDPQASHRHDQVVGNQRLLSWATPEDFYNTYRAFKITRTKEGSGMEYVFDVDDPYFKITPLAGSVGECTGLIFPFSPEFKGTYGEPILDRALFRTKPVYLPPGNGKEMLLLSIDMLYDPRYNPFESADTGSEYATNNLTEWQEYERRAGWVTVPLRITLRDEDGKVSHVFNNWQTFDVHHTGDEVVGLYTSGYWTEYDPRAQRDVNERCYAQWYECESGKPAMDGWSTNKPTIGIWPYAKDMRKYYQHGPNGMLIKYPPKGGFIEIAVLNGVMIHRRGNYASSGAEKWPSAGNNYLTPTKAVLPADAEFMKKCRWRAFRNLSLKIVGGKDGDWQAREYEDVVIEGAVDTNAREELNLDTKCGTVREPVTGMLGLYQLPTGPIWSMIRGGEQSYLERILIGSLYSQYANRRLVIAGDATESIMKLPIFAEHNSPGLFLVSRSKMDAASGTEDVTLINVFADSFTAEPIEPLPEYEFEDATDDRNKEPEFDSSADLPFGPESDDPDEPYDPGDYPDPWDDDDPYWDDRFEDRDRYDD